MAFNSYSHGLLINNQALSTTSDVTFNAATLIAPGTSDSDVITKNYVDKRVWKASCYATTNSNLTGYVYDSGTLTLTAGSVGVFLLDSTSPAVNSRILVKNQSDAKQNGIYVLTTAGTVLVKSVLTRAYDMNSEDDVQAGSQTYVEQGSINANRIFSLGGTGTLVLDTDSLNFDSINHGDPYGDVINGTFVDGFTFTGASDGVTITGTFTGSPTTMEVNFSSGSHVITTPKTVTLTAGASASVPVERFVYILASDVNTIVEGASWPATEYVPIGRFVMQDAVTFQSNNFLKLHQFSDHIRESTGQGHMTAINKWIRSQHATWISGVTISVAGDGTSDFSLSTSNIGTISQLHDHIFPIFANPSPLYIINHATPYTKITNLCDIIVDSSGGTLSNKYYSLVLWGIINKTGSGQSKLMINIPSGTYNSLANAITDGSKTTNYTIPTLYRGVGFLIHRFVVRLSGGILTIQAGGNIDLRGTFPDGDSGGSIAIGTKFVDSAFTIEDDLDTTKLMKFQLSSLTTGTTRTITMADRSLDLGSPTFDVATVQLNDGLIIGTYSPFANTGGGGTGLTLKNIDDLDSTTTSTISSHITSLSNLSLIGGQGISGITSGYVDTMQAVATNSSVSFSDIACNSYDIGGTMQIAQANCTKLELGKSGAVTQIKGDCIVSGNLAVTGATIASDAEVHLITDPHINLNQDYTSTSATTSGVVVNYQATSTATLCSGAGVFTAGVAGVSNPTVTTTSSATFSLGDIIQIAASTDTTNNGLFEVLSHVGTLLTIRGVGLTGTVEDFSQTQFASTTDINCIIHKVNVSCMRSGTDGAWETGKGSASGITYSDLLVSGSDATINDLTVSGTLAAKGVIDTIHHYVGTSANVAIPTTPTDYAGWTCNDIEFLGNDIVELTVHYVFVNSGSNLRLVQITLYDDSTNVLNLSTSVTNDIGGNETITMSGTYTHQYSTTTNPVFKIKAWATTSGAEMKVNNCRFTVKKITGVNSYVLDTF